jgi:polar amino acid transport system substrate-binding protein
MEGPMIKRLLLTAACLAALSGAATAQEFRHEAVPLFDNCGDPSYDKAKTDGITLGISPSPPYSSLAPGSDKAEGLDVEINVAALNWAGITKI